MIINPRMEITVFDFELLGVSLQTLWILMRHTSLANGGTKIKSENFQSDIKFVNKICLVCDNKFFLVSDNKFC